MIPIYSHSPPHMIGLGIKWISLLTVSSMKEASIKYLRVISHLGCMNFRIRKILISINNGLQGFNRLPFLEISTIGIEPNTTPKKYNLSIT